MATTMDIFKSDILKDKVIICSSGGSGICRAMTEAVVRHGGKVVIISRSLERLLEKAAKEMSKAAGGAVIPTQADVRNPADVENAVAKTVEKFGKIDYLINVLLVTF